MNGESMFQLTNERRAVIDCVDAYESTDADRRDDLRRFVLDVPEPFRPAAIGELIKVDMEYRWKAGRPKTTGEYLQEFPEIAGDAESSLALLKYETHVRSHTRATESDSTRGSTPTEWDMDGRESDMGQTSDLPPAGPHEATLGAADITDVADAPRHRLTHIGRFRIEKELGRGTFGVVYRCHDEQLHRDVAIKIPHPARRMSSARVKEFLHEAKVSARMKHPGIVTILDTGKTQDRRGFIVYEYIRGVTLKDRILAGNLDRRQAVLWIAEVAEALHYAHKTGLVHRDIKPANILVDDEGKTHLTDFGLAKIDDQFFTDDAGRVLGTVAYMNPEQASGQAHWASPQSDIYSLGVVLYEILCGKRPFTAGSSLDLIKQVEQRPPSPPRTVDDSIPPALEEVCLKAMAKDPDQRYRTAADMAAALRAAVAPRKGPSPVIRAMKLTAALAAAAAVVVAAILIRESLLPGPVTNPDVASPPQIDLTFILQRGEDQKTGDFIELRESQRDAKTPRVLRTGDLWQLDTAFEPATFPYVFRYHVDGRAEMLWPDKDDSDDPEGRHQMKELMLPIGADLTPKPEYFKLEGDRRGPQMIVVAVSDKRLSADEVAEFASQKVVLPPNLGKKGFVWEKYPRDFGSESGVRGSNGFSGTRSGDATPVTSTVTSEKMEISRAFMQRLKDRFTAFSIFAFYYEVNTEPLAEE